MTNAHSFPLLPLPHLARVHIIKQMDILELYHLSTLSKKSKKLVKICYIPCILDMQLGFFGSQSGRRVSLSIRKDQRSEPFLILITTNEYVASPYDRNYSVVLKVENFRELAMEQLKLVNEQFKISRFELGFTVVPNDITRHILGIVRGLKIDIYLLSVENFREVDDEMYTWVMDECRDVKRLTNSCKTTQEYEWNTQQPFTFERCYLLYSPFLTLDHLTRLFWNCRFFQTEDKDHEMTTQDLNQLVKLWMSGSSKLEVIEIIMNASITFQEVLADIEKVPVRSAYIENMLENFCPGFAFKIQQTNGTEAVVCLSMLNDFVITTHFEERYCDLWIYLSSDEEDDGVEGDQDDEEEEEDDF